MPASSPHLACFWGVGEIVPSAKSLPLILLFLWDSHGFCWCTHTKTASFESTCWLIRNFFFQKTLPFIFPKTSICEIISKCFHIVYLISFSKWPCKVDIISVSILKQRLKELKGRVRLRSYVVVGLHLRFRSAGTSANSLRTAPVVFSLFVIFKQRTHFFQTETKLFQMKRGVPALWGPLRGAPWRLQPPTEHDWTTLHFSKVPHTGLPISRP